MLIIQAMGLERKLKAYKVLLPKFLFWMFNLPRFINSIIYKWTDLINFILYALLKT